MRFFTFPLRLLLALLAGMTTTLAYAPFSIALLGIAGPTVLLLLLHQLSPKKAVLLGLLYGIGLFGTGTWWIYISVHEFGHLTVPLAILATILLVLYESFYIALFGYLLNRLTPIANTLRFLVFFPASWVLLEWLRSSFLTGWHWLILGYTQIDAPLAGYAPLIGVYGLSLLSAMTAGLAALIIVKLYNKIPYAHPTSWFYRFWQTKCDWLLIAIIWVNGALLSHYQFTAENGQFLDVALIQGNIPQEQKWQPDQLPVIVDQYHAATKNNWQSDLIVWPEAAIPALSTVAEPFLEALAKEAKHNNAHVILGIPVAEGKHFYNAMLLLGQSEGRYYKRHLVPFGEYLPLKSIFTPLLDMLDIPMSDFNKGPLQQPLLRVKSIDLAGYICYEIVEPDEVRRGLQQAQLIVTITDDSWFDGSVAAEQHLQMARMRSLENGLPQLFLSSRGASAVVSPQGKILQVLAEHKKGVITTRVQATVGNTPWRHLGSWPVLLIASLCVMATAIGFWQRLRTW